MAETLAHPGRAGAVVFVGADFDGMAGSIRLVYRFDNGPELVETISFPGNPGFRNKPSGIAFKQALNLLHLIAGVSYYKAGAPNSLLVESSGLVHVLSLALASKNPGGIAPPWAWYRHLWRGTIGSLGLESRLRLLPGLLSPGLVRPGTGLAWQRSSGACGISLGRLLLGR